MSAERRIVGALLTGTQSDYRLYSSYLGVVTAPELRQIIERMDKLALQGRDWDVGTISEEFSGHPVITAEYLADLLDDAPVVESIPRLVLEVQDSRFRDTMEETVRSDVTAAELAELLQAKIWEYQRSGGGSIDRKGMWQNCLAEIERTMVQGVEYKTGITSVDAFIGGFFRTELTVLAARPSTGKTALAIQIANHLIESGKRVLFIDLEVGAYLTMARILSHRTGVSLGAIIKGYLTDLHLEKLVKESAVLTNKPLFLNDRTGMKVGDIYAQAMATHADFVIVDYLSYLVPGGEDKVGEMGNACRGLQTLAKALNIPVLLLAQLNRKLEDRNDKRPRLSDLRASGEIEEAACNVYFLHWPYKYEPLVEPEGKQIFLAAKQKHGPVGDIEIAWDPPRMKFSDLGAAG